MGKRRSPEDQIRDDAPAAFAFLLDERGFLGPERLEDGVAYHRPDLHVSVTFWAWKNETGFETTVWDETDSQGQRHRASLSCLYVACGLGPPQAVPSQGTSGYVIAKRIGQHSDALRRVMPYLDGPDAASLFRRCHG
jgi:hypothetical protein